MVKSNVLDGSTGLRSLEFPELLEELSGRVGFASAVRLSSEPLVLYTHKKLYAGAHVFFPGEDTSTYITTWVDDAGRSLSRMNVESVLYHVLLRWGTGRAMYIWENYPTKPACRSLLETLAMW